MSKSLGKILSEGKTKIVRETESSDVVLLEFKDSITALDGEKMDTLRGKAIINSHISAYFLELLEKEGVPTHFVEFIEPNMMKVKNLEMIPVEVVCRNIAAGHLVKNYPIEEGTPLNPPVVEFYLKDDARHDPMLNDDHLVILGLASREEVKKIREIALETNRVLREALKAKGLTLVDFKIEVGRGGDGKIYVGDEINGDSMRIWEEGTNKILDKDVYRKGGTLDEVLDTYVKLYERLLGEPPPIGGRSD
ncbi:MAG: phosphoribosylaminoimidazolesuccinocarboxamide synthase [Candidatus Freyrarchaeum guaymaensis]|nr:phosphoribosylaminoimidazolesuccinocarboxamide synthase [Candidatus Sigynarchaeota archaeon]